MVNTANIVAWLKNGQTVEECKMCAPAELVAAAVAELEKATQVSDTQILTRFENRALPLIARRIPVIPVPARTKAAKLDNWQELASTDPAQIAEWGKQEPDANVACVAKAKTDGIWMLDIDKPNFVDVIEKQTGQKMPVTLTVRSSDGRGHFYFRQTPESIAMGNRQGKDENGKEAWSARVSDRYCIGPGSVHPSGSVYTILVDKEIAPAPQWLIDFCSRSQSKTGHTELDDESPIAEGSRNNSLASILGKARQVLGMNKEQLFEYGKSVNQNRCVPPLSDNEVHTIANSVGSYDVKPVGKFVLESHAPVEIDIPKLKNASWPKFPSWVMHGTSLYEGFVKPWCQRNSRIPYFMFLPAAGLMLNYLGLKVQVEYRSLIPSMFMVLIGEKGRAIKSTSVEDAIDYLSVAGIVKHESDAVHNAEGKSMIFTAGSPEGLGLAAARMNAKNLVLYYDELSALTSKAEIDSSSLKAGLLTLYGSGKFSNRIKSRKESFSFDPRSYCASLVACTTNDNFEDHWSKLAGKSSGLDDRFMFVLQPEVLPELTPLLTVNTVAGSFETKKLIDKAVLQKTYQIADPIPLEQTIGVLGNRAENRAEKWALYFAVDLGRSSIDEDCIERGIAIAQYEQDVKRYLGNPEAETKIASAQIKYRRMLERKGGRAGVRDMERSMSSHRYGTEGWWRIYDGLKKAGIIAELGTGMPGSPKEVVIRVPLDE